MPTGITSKLVEAELLFHAFKAILAKPLRIGLRSQLLTHRPSANKITILFWSNMA